jgi:hypothetical protein
VVLTSALFRNQTRNRRDVEDVLVDMFRVVLEPLPPHHPTHVPQAERQRRRTARQPPVQNGEWSRGHCSSSHGYTGRDRAQFEGDNRREDG